MAIADLRKDYSLDTLDREKLAAEPIAQFQHWFDAARGLHGGRLRRFGVDMYKAFAALFGSGSIEANAMTLATADGAGKPSARTVLLKGVDERGFTFFTNYDSRKGQELTQNPNAALVFYWADLERQVCIAGSIEKLSREESSAYFHSRPRGSQIAAAASKQSEVIASRDVLAEKFKQLETEFANREIPIPPNWGGYVLKPARVEFWQGRPSRMHDRFRYLRKEDGTWQIDRLSP
jgi:pyridoxamine 5'-phosphate oxidase